MTLTDIANLRLRSQQIAASESKTVKDVLSRMAAIQAQDLSMAALALGIRCPSATSAKINAAMDKGAILRTHLLRPTWHLVAADDIYWLLDLTAPYILAAQKSRHKELELSEAVFKKSAKTIEKALSKGRHLLREELLAELQQAKIPTDENRSSHLLFHAELNGIICSGKTRDNKQTYALLAERVPNKKTLSREEALATLANRYFSSRGPATLKDFINWSGLSVTDAKRAMETVKSGLLQETLNGDTYWFNSSLTLPPDDEPAVHLLPGFDEFIIAYKDRSASLPPHHTKKVVNVNGIFRPALIVNGQVKGLWRRTLLQDKVVIEIEYFEAGKRPAKKLLEQAAGKIGLFYGRKAENRTLQS
jgi:hypothetical protein